MSVGAGTMSGMAADTLTGWWGTVLDSPDPPALARFYANLLQWELNVREPGWATVKAPDVNAYLGFHHNELYVRPVWPSAEGEQQQMMHLDVGVDDLPTAVERAVGLGATVAEFQPQEDVRVMLDPDGHPFCLYLDT
jgi:catechol 2,3-dioxygenase-like lactoylglutathione lyase family enzyme